MQPIRVAICEDQSEELSRLMRILQNNPITPVQCTTFSNAEQLLGNYHPDQYDLLFMDIMMTGISGIEAVRQIRLIDTSVMIAFVTASLDYTLESYRLNVIKYIEKPAQQRSVHELLELAVMKRNYAPKFQYMLNGKTGSLSFSQILYIEQSARNLILHLTDGSALQLSNLKLDSIEPQFEMRNFYRCHKSYFVNLQYIKRYDGELAVFEMQNGSNVYIRRNSLSEAKHVYEKYLFDSVRGDLT